MWGCSQSGDKVVYSKYAGTELKMATTEYVLLKVCANLYWSRGCGSAQRAGASPACAAFARLRSLTDGGFSGCF